MAPAPVAAKLRNSGANSIASDGDHGAPGDAQILTGGGAGWLQGCGRVSRRGLPALPVSPAFPGRQPGLCDRGSPPGTWNPSSRVVPPCVLLFPERVPPSWLGWPGSWASSLSAGADGDRSASSSSPWGCPDCRVASLGSCWDPGVRLGMASVSQSLCPPVSGPGSGE